MKWSGIGEIGFIIGRFVSPMLRNQLSTEALTENVYQERKRELSFWGKKRQTEWVKTERPHETADVSCVCAQKLSWCENTVVRDLLNVRTLCWNLLMSLVSYIRQEKLTREKI